MVRVKITLPDSAYIYIDDNGGINASSAESKLDSAALDRVREILDRLAK